MRGKWKAQKWAYLGAIVLMASLAWPLGVFAGSPEMQVSPANSISSINPGIDGNVIVYEDHRNGNADIYMYNILTGAETVVAGGLPSQSNPMVSGDNVFWMQWKNGKSGKYARRISTGAVRLVTEDHDSNVSVDGETAVWLEQRFGNNHLFKRDLVSGIESTVTTVSTYAMEPVIDQGRVIWADSRNDLAWGDWWLREDSIRMLNLSTLAESTVTTTSVYDSDMGRMIKDVGISGNNVIWKQRSGSDWADRAAIRRHELTSLFGVDTTITDFDNSGYQWWENNAPRVGGNGIIWKQNDILYRHDLITGAVSQVGTPHTIAPWGNSIDGWLGGYAIDGNRIVWADNRQPEANHWTRGAIFLMDTADGTGPSVRLHTPRISTGVSKTRTFPVRWSATDPSGVISYTVQTKTGVNGTWLPWLTDTRLARSPFRGKTGTTHYFRAQARDGVGNVGPWSRSMTIVPHDQGIASKVGGWVKYKTKGLFLGTAMRSAQANDTATFTFKGKSVTLIGTKGKNFSRAEISIDGKPAKTIRLGSKKTKVREELFSKTFKRVKKHTMTIRNVDNKTLEIDGLAVEN